jgi:PIN like domain
VSRIKPAEVRYYVDADLLGLGHVLAGLRSDVTYPGDTGVVIHKRQRPPCPITSPAVKDSEWIPSGRAGGWLILTRDRHIREHRLKIGGLVFGKRKGRRRIDGYSLQFPWRIDRCDTVSPTSVAYRREPTNGALGDLPRADRGMTALPPPLRRAARSAADERC